MQKCNSVEKIVFDGMDSVNHRRFRSIIHGMGAVPQQVRAEQLYLYFFIFIIIFQFVLQIIVTSTSWRPVHREMYNKQTKDYLIFGAPLDIAMAANTKFDVIFANKQQMSQTNTNIYKLRSVLGTHSVLLETHS